MCGLVYYKSFTGHKVNQQILQQYKSQCSRGHEGFGFYIPKTNRLAHHPAEHRIKKLLKRNPATEIMFHHRLPTSTANVRNACHPFSTKDYFGERQYILIHNGYLSNQRELKQAHEALGITYVSEQPNGQFNDSEALMWDIALYLEGKQTELKSHGAIAFIVIERDKNGPRQLHFGRNSYPLRMKLNDNELSLASEGRGELIDSDQLYTFDYAAHALMKQKLTIPEYGNRSQHYNGWNYSTPKYTYTATETAQKITTMEDASALLERCEWNYADALGAAERRVRNAKSTLRLVEDYVSDGSMTEATGANEMMEQLAIIERWSDVATMLRDWQIQVNETKAVKAGATSV